MPLLTAQGISRVAIALLTRRLVLPRTCTAIPGAEFSGSNGDTITVRVPQPGTATQQVTPGANLTPSAIDEIPVDVSLNHWYHAKDLTDEELAFDLEDYARQVLRVQVAAIATAAENEVAGALNGLAVDGAIEFAASASAADTKAAILAAREALGGADVPLEDRFFVVSPEIATRVLQVEDFTRADASGSTDALRNAVLGRIYGFTFLESTALSAGTAVAYHRSGVAFANKAPLSVAAEGVLSATATEQGISLRTVRAFQPGNLTTRSVVSTFAGASVVFDDNPPTVHPRVIRIGTAT